MKTNALIRLILSTLTIFSAGAVGTVSVMSILSDIVTNPGSFTATENVIAPDTLDIAGAYQVYLNGSATPEPTNDVTLSAGDVAVVKATITNFGNVSTWIRDTFVYEGSTYLSVASGEHTASEFEDGTAWPATGIYHWWGMGDEGVTGDSSGYETSVRVLNGTGVGAQIETIGNAPQALIDSITSTVPAQYQDEYFANLFVGSNSYTVAFSAYFDPEIATDGGEIATFSVAKTEALQYRDNNSIVPGTHCIPMVGCTDDWSVVVSSPIGL